MKWLRREDVAWLGEVAERYAGSMLAAAARYADTREEQEDAVQRTMV